MTANKVTLLNPGREPDVDAPVAETFAAGRPVLQVDGVDKIYGNGTVALKRADLTIKQGEFDRVRVGNWPSCFRMPR